MNKLNYNIFFKRVVYTGVAYVTNTYQAQSSIIPVFSKKVKEVFRIFNPDTTKTKNTRNRIFDGSNLFLSVLNLHANCSSGNANTALNMVFGDRAPTESAFSQMRNKISWEYFEDFFNRTAKAFCEKKRPKYKDYFLTSVDGDQYLLERTADAVEQGFKGQKCGKDLETFGLKMYLTLATCMITGAPIAIKTGTSQNELELGICTTKQAILNQSARNGSKNKRKKQIFCYDRLYFSNKIIELHKESATFFIVRCKVASTFSEVKNFISSGKNNEITEINGQKIRLIKSTHNSTDYYYATNNCDPCIDDETVSWIYFRRWQSETTNCHAAKTIAIERFHSKKINGIRQEIYSSFWGLLIANSNDHHVSQTKEDFHKKIYRRQNTKAVFGVVLQNTKLILKGLNQEFFAKLKDISKKSSRKVTRLLRSCIRMRKYRRNKKYPQQKAVPILRF